MKRSHSILAWRKYPEPDGTVYTAEELWDEELLETIFDYCQILEAAIFAEGWHLLFQAHRMHGLVRIARLSGWCDDPNDAEVEDLLIYHARIAGYDYGTSQFGEYEVDSGIFRATDEEHTE